MPYYQEMSTKTRNMMIRKYIEETGLNIAQDFDIDTSTDGLMRSQCLTKEVLNKGV